MSPPLPTPPWIVTNRNDADADGKRYYDIAFAKRPEEELYHLRNDPDEITNVADAAAHAETKKALAEWMMAILKNAKDPRVQGDGSTFDKPPYTGLPEKFRNKKKR